MNIFDRFMAIKATCEFPFASFREIIADLEKNGRRNGLTSPVAQIIIKASENKGEYDACVLVCYKTTGDKYEQIKKDFRIYSFKNLPNEIKTIIDNYNEAKLTFNQEDVEELVLNRNLEVHDGKKGLSSLLDETLSKTSHATNKNIQLVIRDFILYNRVIINLRTETGSNEYVTEFLTDDIIGIPKTELNNLKHNHEISLLIKH